VRTLSDAVEIDARLAALQAEQQPAAEHAVA
jgi:hypothetical protein